MEDEIPAFRSDGYLPEGLHPCSEAAAIARFGRQNHRRRRLALRVRRWCELGRSIGAKRLLLDGSFVTAKVEPEDVDAVMLLPENFGQIMDQGSDSAMELLGMFLTRQPEELFAAESEAIWWAWCKFFSRTRETDNRNKGLVEVRL